MFSTTAFAFSNNYQKFLEHSVFLRQQQDDKFGHEIVAMRAGTVIDLHDGNYGGILGGDKPVLVDACATWCGPCKLIEPTVHKVAEKWSDRLTVAKFDVENKNSDNLKLEMMLQKCMPQRLPSLILFYEKKAVAIHNGVITEEELHDFLESNFPEQAASTPKKTAGFISFRQQEPEDYMLSINYDKQKPTDSDTKPGYTCIGGVCMRKPTKPAWFKRGIECLAAEGVGSGTVFRI